MGQPTNKNVLMVVTACNRLGYLSRSLYSLDNHDAGYPFKLIIVDDNSEDDTRSFLKEQHHKIFFNPKPLGSGQNVKRSWELALTYKKWDYLVNADSDYVYSDNWLKIIIENLESKPEIGISTGFNHPDDPPIEGMIFRINDRKCKYVKSCIGGNFAIKREWVEKLVAIPDIWDAVAWDYALSSWVFKNGGKIISVVCSVVQHIGKVGVCCAGECVEGEKFVGE